MKIKSSKWKPLLLVIMALLPSLVFAEIKGNIDNNPRTVNTKTQLSISLDEWQGQNILQAGSQIHILFPPSDFEHYFQSLNAQISTVACLTDYGFAALEQLQCSVNKSTRKITAVLSQNSAMSYLGFILNDLINPDSERRTSPFIVELYGPSGTKIDQSDANSAKFTIRTDPDIMESVTLSTQNGTVSSFTNLKVTIKLKHDLGTNADIVLTFPRWDAQSDFPTKSYIFNQMCSIFAQSDSNINSGASCEFKAGTQTDTVRIKNALYDGWSSANPVVFTLGKIRNPGSLRGTQNIIVETQKSFDQTNIERKFNCILKPTDKFIVNKSYYSVSFANEQVSTLTNFFLRIRTFNPVPKGGVIKVKFPPEVALTDPTGTQSYLNSVKQGRSFMNFYLSSSASSAKDTVIITNAFDQFTDSDTTLNLQFSQVMTPISSAETQSFDITIQEAVGTDFFDIEGIFSGLTIRTEPQRLTEFQFKASNSNVFAPFAATVITRLNGLLKTDNEIELIYPSSMTVDGKMQTSGSIACGAKVGDNMYSPVCVVDLVGRKVLFKRISTLNLDFTQVTGGQLVELTMNSLFVNPPDENPIDVSFKLSVKDTAGNVIAFFEPNTTYSYAAKAVEVNQFTIGTSSQVTGEYGNYTLTLSLLKGQHLPADTFFDLKLPNQVGLAEYVGCKKMSSILENNPSCLQTLAHSISIQLVNQTAAIVGPVTISFEINSIRNPFSTNLTESFAIIALSGENYPILKQSRGLTIAVSLGSKFGPISIVRGSTRNGKLTWYRFNIELRNPAPSSSKMIVSIPETVGLRTLDGVFMDCSGSGSLKTSIECKVSSKKVQVDLVTHDLQDLQAGSNVTFTLYDVQNPNSLKRTGNFGFELKSSDRTFLYSSQSSGVTIQNTEASQIVLAEVIAENPTLGSDSPYKINFTPNTALLMNGKIEVTLPDTLTRSKTLAFNCTGVTNLPPILDCTYTASNHSVMISTSLPRDQSLPEQTVFVINGFKNPSEPRFSQSFQIRTYDSEMFLSEEKTDGLSFTQQCDYPCKTCGLSKKTCLSCQLDSAYKMLFNNTCLDKCPAGRYADGNFECQKCSSECNTCSESANFCTSCSNPFDFLHEKSGSCVSKCPDGQFTDVETGVCFECNKNCTTCTGLNTCTSCKHGLFLEAGTCYDKCPLSMIPSLDQKQCVNCQKPCSSCFETVDQCTSCDGTSGLSYLYGYKCVDQCPSGYAPSVSDGFTCILVTEDVVPFVFLIVAFIASLGIGIAKVFKTNIHYKNTQIGVISAISLANWFFLIYLTVKDRMWQSTVVLLYGIISSYILNAIFFCLYLKVMRQDEFYNKWRDRRKTRETILVGAALLTSFQLYRIAFQQLSAVIKESKQQHSRETFGPSTDTLNEGGSQNGPEIDTRGDDSARSSPIKKETTNEGRGIVQSRREYKFADENGVKSIFNKLTIIMISCVLLPVLIQNIYNLHFTHPGRQLFWEDCESICITGYLLILMVWDSYKKTKKIEFAQIKRKVPTMGKNLAGIPNDLDSMPNADVYNLFNSTAEMKRFRDVLSAMVKQKHLNKIAISAVEEIKQDRDDIEFDDQSDILFTGRDGPPGKYNQNSGDSTFRNLNLQRQRTQNGKALIGGLDLTGVKMKPSDTTGISLFTEDGVTERHLISQRQTTTRGDESMRKFIKIGDIERNFRSPINEVDEETKNFKSKSETLGLDGNILTTQNADVSGDNTKDQNRHNIHGVEDSEIINELELSGNQSKMTHPENLRESTVFANRRLIGDINGVDDLVVKNIITGEDRTSTDGIQDTIEQSVVRPTIEQQMFSLNSNQPKGSMLGINLSTEQREGGMITLQSTVGRNQPFQGLATNNTNKNSQVSALSSPNFKPNKKKKQNQIIHIENNETDGIIHNEKELTQFSSPQTHPKGINESFISPSPGIAEEENNGISGNYRIQAHPTEKLGAFASNKISVATSQLTIDEKNHPVDKIDDLNFKMKMIKLEAAKVHVISSYGSIEPIPQGVITITSEKQTGINLPPKHAGFNERQIIHYSQDDLDDEIKMLEGSLKQVFSKNHNTKESKRAIEITNMPSSGHKKQESDKLDLRSKTMKKKEGSGDKMNVRPLTAEIYAGKNRKKDLTQRHADVNDGQWIKQLENQQQLESIIAGSPEHSPVNGASNKDENKKLSPSQRHKKNRDNLVKQLMNAELGEQQIENEDQLKWYKQITGTDRKTLKGSNYASSLARSFSPGGKRQMNLPQNKNENVVKNQDKIAKTHFKQDSKSMHGLGARKESEVTHQLNQILGYQETIRSRKSDFSSERDDMRGIQKVSVPAISRLSSELAPEIMIKGKNSQEKQYYNKILNKDLMSPDLKIDDLNKGIVFTNRSKSSRKESPSANVRSRTSNKSSKQSCSRFAQHTERQAMIHSRKSSNAPLPDSNTKNMMQINLMRQTHNDILASGKRKINPELNVKMMDSIPKFNNGSKTTRDYLENQIESFAKQRGETISNERMNNSGTKQIGLHLGSAVSISSVKKHQQREVNIDSKMSAGQLSRPTSSNFKNRIVLSDRKHDLLKFSQNVRVGMEIVQGSFIDEDRLSDFNGSQSRKFGQNTSRIQSSRQKMLNNMDESSVKSNRSKSYNQVIRKQH